jgi:exosortase C (VPDSG-CTERM-specific)
MTVNRADNPQADIAETPSVSLKADRADSRRRVYRCGFLILLLSALFVKPLIVLGKLALADNLYSHLVLIPVVSAYLIRLKLPALPSVPSNGRRVKPAVAPLIFGALVLAGWFMAPHEWRNVPANSASLLILSYVCFIWAIFIAVLGWNTIRRLLFPVAFLLFLVPFPIAVTNQIEGFFQHTSAHASSLLFGISQTPVLRDGLIFKLPGVTLEVAQECSGIRSTLVLFITSLVGGYVFFQSKRYRVLFALAVIPIAILRNALRIFTIAMLCVHVDPGMIDSFIHRRGGPLFFALSLVPFFALLIFLYRRERKLSPRG